MSTPAEPTIAPRPRRRWLRRLALFGLIACTLLLGLQLAWYAYATADLSEARTEAAAAGLISEPALVIPPPCADADNAALRYQIAYGLLTVRGSPYVPGREAGELDPRLEKLRELVPAKVWDRSDAPTRENAQAVILHEDFSAAWRLVAEGSRLQRCVFPSDYGAGPGMLLPHLTLCRIITQLGSLRARSLAAQGRAQEAADQLADLLWAMRQQDEAPVLISHLVKINCDEAISEELRRLLIQGQLAKADLSRCEAALAEHDSRAALARCLDGEAAFVGSWVFRNLDTDTVATADLASQIGTGDYYPLWWLYQSWPGIPIRRGDEAMYLRLLAQTRSAISRDLPLPAQVPPTPRYLYPIAGMLLPATELLNTERERGDRIRNATRLILVASRGGTPRAIPGVSVEQRADGAWDIRPEPLPGKKYKDGDTWTRPVSRSFTLSP